MKINLFTQNPPVGGSKLIFFTPLGAGQMKKINFFYQV